MPKNKLCYKNTNIARISTVFRKKIIKFAPNAINKASYMKDLNRIKVVLVEKKKTNKWLAEQLGKDPATVSKWCTNVSQPSLDTLVEVSKALDVDVRELLVSTKEKPKYIRVE